ncbi:MAG TPA: hypothetical protein VJ385_08650 [Fibrobacteria bacterium]|nr:hypothetical protein [Fibrobacteria bacterium]
MLSKLRTLGFAAAAFSLFACNPQDKSATGPSGPGPEGATGTGSARFALPALSQGYLAKSAAGKIALFDLTVYGEGMAPIHQSWPLSPGGRDSAIVTGIPAGPKRIFYGRLIQTNLIQSDTAGRDTLVTHEGSDSVLIRRDSTSDVHLYLKKVGGNGSAHVCVEVEGWPSDSACVQPPVIPPFPLFRGCWNVAITKPGPTRQQDSVFKAKLRIFQRDSVLSAVITWNSGKKDSAYGYVILPGGYAVIGYNGGHGDFTLRANLIPSKVDTTHPLELFGWFNDSLRNIYGNLAGSRTSCDSVIVPPIDSTLHDTVRACFNVSQNLVKGKSGSGRLGLVARGARYVGYLHWNGLPAMTSREDFLGRFPLDSASITLRGKSPAGMWTTTPQSDTVSYQIRLRPTGTAVGTVSRLFPAGWSPAGTWNATASACTEKDLRP